MNKQRAIYLYKNTILAERAGAGILGTEIEHVFYEVEKYLEENNWLEEAKKELNSIIEKKRIELTPILEDYYTFLLEGREDKELENFFKNKIYTFNVNGDEEEIILYKVNNNGKEPTKEELKLLLDKRHEEDEKYMKTFLEAQVCIYFGELYNNSELNEAVEKLRERRLLKKAYRKIIGAVTEEKLRRLYEAEV